MQKYLKARCRYRRRTRANLCTRQGLRSIQYVLQEVEQSEMISINFMHDRQALHPHSTLRTSRSLAASFPTQRNKLPGNADENEKAS